MEYPDVMIDLETLGTVPDGVIVQIAAVKFNIVTRKVYYDHFLHNIEAQSCIDAGMSLNVDTILWWMGQSQEARSIFANSDRIKIGQALSLFNHWYDSDTQRIWCHTTFDYPILNNAFLATGIQPKYSHYIFRDLRTIVDLANVDYRSRERKGVHHNALNDCLFQIEYVCDAYEILKKK